MLIHKLYDTVLSTFCSIANSGKSKFWVNWLFEKIVKYLDMNTVPSQFSERLILNFIQYSLYFCINIDDSKIFAVIVHIVQSEINFSLSFTYLMFHEWKIYETLRTNCITSRNFLKFCVIPKFVSLQTRKVKYTWYIYTCRHNKILY